MSLSNETMNLFLAPWNIEQNMDVFELYNCKDLCSFACTDEKNAHRFVLLPDFTMRFCKQPKMRAGRATMRKQKEYLTAHVTIYMPMSVTLQSGVNS